MAEEEEEEEEEGKKNRSRGNEKRRTARFFIPAFFTRVLAPENLPFQPLFVRMHKLFFSPGFPLQLCEKSVAFGSSRDSTTSVIFFTPH